MIKSSYNAETGELLQVEMTPEEVAAWEAEQAAAAAPNVAKQITEAPDDLFGGPTLEEVFNGN